MKCKICELRKPRRHCPGIHGDICPICCGNEREQTINCPLDCPYLREARTHEKPPDIDPATIPNRDIEVTREFLDEHEELIVFTTAAVLEAAFETPGAVDYDIRDALDALIRTYRTMASGLYYDSRPQNTVAAAIYDAIRRHVEELSKKFKEHGESVRDRDLLGAFVHLQHFEMIVNNGRRRGRAFIDALQSMFPRVKPPAPDPPSLVLP